jgi:flavodoxin
MLTVIIYASVHHGNTRRIAEAMAGALLAELLPVEQAASLKHMPELVGFGLPLFTTVRSGG